MNNRERVLASFRGDDVDHPALSIWHHWPGIDHDPGKFAQAEIDQQCKYDFDFVKVTPSGMIAVQDWGVEVGPPYNDHGEPSVNKYAINSLQDWERIKPQCITTGRLAQEIEALRRITEKIKNSALIFQTVFFPLTNAGKLAGARLLDDIRENPDVIEKALDSIAETTISFIRSCIIDGNVDGVFLSTKYGDASLMNSDEYKKISMPYDMRVLEAIADLHPINILHLHGNDILFELFKYYPVDAINWHDRNGKMSIKEAKSFFTQGLIAGLSNDTEYLMNASSDELYASVKDAINQADGRRICIGPGCVFPVGMPEEKLYAIRKAVK